MNVPKAVMFGDMDDPLFLQMLLARLITALAHEQAIITIEQLPLQQYCSGKKLLTRITPEGHLQLTVTQVDPNVH